MFPTKTDSGRAGHKSMIELTRRAMRLRQESIAGYPRPRHLMANIEFEAYLTVMEGCNLEELRHRSHVETFLKMGFGIKTG